MSANKTTPVRTTGSASKSIAGRLHGAKPATQTQQPSTQKWYPQVDGKVHEDVANALRVILDQQYAIQEKQMAMEKSAQGGATGAKEGAKAEKPVPDSAMATGIHGIRIKAVTDSTTLQNGATLRFNSTSGEFEIKM